MRKYGLTQKEGIIKDKIWAEKIGAKKPRPTKWRNIEKLHISRTETVTW
jgi:hypothetical protein